LFLSEKLERSAPQFWTQISLIGLIDHDYQENQANQRPIFALPF
jgi:hypothetical protein